MNHTIIITHAITLLLKKIQLYTLVITIDQTENNGTCSPDRI